MFQLLESEDQIAKAQRALERTIFGALRRESVKGIGYPGGSKKDARVRTDGAYWFWSADHRGPQSANPRRLNWWGLYSSRGVLQISVEVNTPYAGRNKNIAGFFARDVDSQRLYLFHSGRVGGGTKGVKKSAFLAHGHDKLLEVVDSEGGVRQGVLVMPVRGRGAVRPARQYVDRIAAFKKAVREGFTKTREFAERQRKLEDFYSESSGRRRGKRRAPIDYQSRHGDVVNELAERIKERPLPKGHRIVKNVLIDAGVEAGGRLVEIYEVKTGASRSDVYSAIGQLMVHGTSSNCRRVIVLPQDERIQADFKNAFERLGIQVIRFKLDVATVTILPG